jgi:hypothetical protein
MTVNLDNGGIDDRVFEVRLIRAGLEKPKEYRGFDPIAISFVHGVPLAEARREIAPWRAGSNNPQHGLDKQPIVLPAAAGVRRLAPTVRFHLRPLGVGQHEALHPKLESCSPSPGESQILNRP